MNRPVTAASPDAALADALRANPNLIGMTEGAAHTERARAGRNNAFIDLRPFVNATWELLMWIDNPRMSDAEHLRHWLNASECMTAIADLPDVHASALSPFPDMHLPTGTPALYESNRRQVALNKAAALASNPSLAGLAALGERRAAAMRVAYAIQAAQAEAAAPSVLLAELRARGVFLVVQDNMLGVPIGLAATALTATDRAAIVRHKSPLVALLTAEAALPTVLVVA